MDTENKERPQFVWACGNGPVFPIDYSQRSFAEYLGGDPRLVKRYLVDHPFFQDILQKQFHGSQEEGRAPDRPSNASASIPVESAAFFNCFYDLVTDEKYHATFCSRKKNIPKEKLEQFTHDLCQKIRLKIEDDSIKGNQYYRHTLYKNRTFQQEILSDLWEQELDRRCQEIRELSKTATPEFQMGVLMDCILSLDRNILNLQIAGKKASAPSGKDAIRSLLLSLIQRAQRKGSSEFASYLLDDIELKGRNANEEETTLKEAFIALSSPPSIKRNYSESLKALRELVRQSYLEHLDDKIKESQFEKQYRLADQYLSVRNNGTAQKLLQGLVTERCKQYWISVLKQCQITPDCSMPAISEEFSSLKYIAQLADYLVSSALSSCYCQYADTIRVVSYLHMAAQVAAKNSFHTQSVLDQLGGTLTYDPIATACPTVDPENNLTFQETVRFSDLFSTAWKNIYQEAIFHPETKQFLDLEQTAHRIYKDGHDNAAYFGHEEYFPYSLEDVQKMMTIYEEVISHPTRFYEYVKMLHFAPGLLIFVLMGVFQRETETKIPQITKHIESLFPACDES